MVEVRTKQAVPDLCLIVSRAKYIGSWYVEKPLIARVGGQPVEGLRGGRRHAPTPLNILDDKKAAKRLVQGCALLGIPESGALLVGILYYTDIRTEHFFLVRQGIDLC